MGRGGTLCALIATGRGKVGAQARVSVTFHDGTSPRRAEPRTRAPWRGTRVGGLLSVGLLEHSGAHAVRECRPQTRQGLPRKRTRAPLFVPPVTSDARQEAAWKRHRGAFSEGSQAEPERKGHSRTHEPRDTRTIF